MPIHRVASNYYGTAGKAFLTALIEELEDNFERTLKILKESLQENISALTPADASPEQARVCRRLAAVQLAGELAVDADILPFPRDEIRASVEFVRNAWLGTHVTIDDAVRGMMRLQEFLIRNGKGLPSINDQVFRNAQAFWDQAKDLFYFTDEQLSEASKFKNTRELAQLLKRNDLLFVNESSRHKAKVKLGTSGKYGRFYAVKAGILTEEFYTTDNES